MGAFFSNSPELLCRLAARGQGITFVPAVLAAGYVERGELGPVLAHAAPGGPHRARLPRAGPRGLPRSERHRLDGGTAAAVLFSAASRYKARSAQKGAPLPGDRRKAEGLTY